MTSSDRLNGWKSIGAYFRRDRTTAMRWAQNRGMPVYKMPVGKSGSVFAFKSELNKWAQYQPNIDENIDPKEIISNEDMPVFSKKINRRIFIGSLSVGGIGIAAMAAINPIHSYFVNNHDEELPNDPALATKYLEARDLWAQRKPETIKAAIALLTEIIKKEPSYSQGWAALADCYLILREFGSITHAEAYETARIVASKALKENQESAQGHRALGFLAYWWDNDCQMAGKHFNRSLERAPKDAQTNFWYGNILSDNGQHAKAINYLNKARLLEPGSIAIKTDLAWATWASGEEKTAKQMFSQILQDNPQFAALHDCLSVVHLSEGDYIGYVQGLTEFARLTENTILQTHAAQLREALKLGVAEVQNILMQKAQIDILEIKGHTHVWTVFLSSIALDRGQTVSLLKIAEQKKEQWGSAGFIARIQRIWFDDKEISKLVQARKAPFVP